MLIPQNSTVLQVAAKDELYSSFEFETTWPCLAEVDLN